MSVAALRARRGDPVGYGLISGAYFLFALAPTIVAWTEAPPSVLLVARYAIAAVVLLVVFHHRRPLAGVLRPGVWQRFLLMAVFDAGQSLAYFYAIRETNVAIATFAYFLQPVWVALLAPRVLHVATERVVYLAALIALGGLALILWPSLAGDALAPSTKGLVAALVAGLLYAGFQITIKRQTHDVPSASVVTTMCLLDGLFLLPLGLWQFAASGWGLTSADLVAILAMGLVTTALAFTMWVDGMARIRVQHGAILGLLTAVATPLYAYVLLGQGVDAWTVAGGALILLAGALVVLFGRGQPDPELPR